jgi:hypothetical protein
MTPELKAWYRKLGKKGGKSKSKAKMEAMRKNLAKAHKTPHWRSKEAQDGK